MINGWRLVGALLLLLGTMTAWLVINHGGDIEGIRTAICTTAHTSVVLFVMAFTAAALPLGGMARLAQVVAAGPGRQLVHLEQLCRSRRQAGAARPLPLAVCWS